MKILLTALVAFLITFSASSQEVVQVRVGYSSAGTSGVSSFAGRSGSVTPQSSDYSSHYPLLSGSYSNPTWIQSLAAGKVTGLHGVATSGNYNDLSNKPTAYTLPIATSAVIGGIRIGTGLSIDGSGVVSTTGTAGVGTFAGRTGTVVPQNSDYSSFYAPLSGSINVTGMAAGDFAYYNGTAWVKYTPPSPGISVTNNGSGVQTLSFTTFQGTGASANWTDQIGSPGTGINITNRTINATGEVLVSTLAYAATRSLDFATSSTVEVLTLAGNVTFSSVNLNTGRSKTVMITCDGSSRTLSFPSGWVFIGPKPTSLAAGKKAVLHLLATSNTDASVIASYNYQE